MYRIPDSTYPRKKEKDHTDNSFIVTPRFSIQYAIRSIKYLRKSELCKANKHDGDFIPGKGFHNQDHYKCKPCGKKELKNHNEFVQIKYILK